MTLDRRTVLIGGGAGIGLVVAFALWPGGRGGPLHLAPGEQGFGAFLKVASDGKVSVAVPQVETGQGIWTSLPQIAADELGAAWEQVAVEPAPLAKAYANLLAGDEGWFAGLGRLRAYQFAGSDKAMITAGSTSVRAFAEPIRLAAAAAREMLVAAAAERWEISPQECTAVGGRVSGAGRTLGFGELAEEASRRRPPSAPELRGAGPQRLLGRSLPRLDGPAKARGAFRFTGDVRLPEMLHAAVAIAPPGGRLAGFERSAAASRDSARLIARDRWIAAVADNFFAAEQALKAASPRFTAPAAAADPRAAFDAALTESDSNILAETGDPGSARAGRKPLAATYYVAPAPNLLPESLAAVARWQGGRAELWSGTQAPGLAAAMAAEDKGLTLYPMPVGGASGRFENRLERIALDLAAELKRPVLAALPAAAAGAASPSSPGLLARLSAVIRADGLPFSWEARLAGAPGLGANLARLAGREPPEALDPAGLADAAAPYSLEHVRVGAAAAHLPFATGYVRGSPQRELAFAAESFIDELARRKGLEPLAFRMALLGGRPRLARCLQQAAARASWDGGGPGSSMGIAGATAFGSAIALVATASIGADQKVAAHRLVAAVDCGQIVNRALAEQQVEGALLWALAAANGSDPGLAAVPEIEVHLLPSDSPPGGLSGLGTLPLAPALANAVHAATGKRMRTLPFDPMAA